MESLKRNDVLGLFTLVSGFMYTFAWNQEREYVPESKATQDQKTKESQFGKTRRQMQLSCTALAMMEAKNVGLAPKEVERHIHSIKNWKHFFVKFMAPKLNVQLKEECAANIKLGARIGRDYKCTHTDGHLLGKTGASALADSIFKSVYDSEVRAFNEPTISPYFSRDFSQTGPVVEYGEIQADQIPRQFVEICQGPYYLSSEDEHSNSSTQFESYGADDEFIENDDFKTHSIDLSVSESRELWGDMRRLVMRAKTPALREDLVRRGEVLAKTDRLQDWQARNLRWFAFQCNQYYADQERKQNALMRDKAVSDANENEEWITL